MTTEYDREDLSPRFTLPHAKYTVVHRSTSSPKTDSFPFASPRSTYLDYDEPASPIILSRNDRAFDQTHRWTVLAREAEADEVSVLSVTSEEIGYYASILPDEPVPPPTQDRGNHTRGGKNGTKRDGSTEDDDDDPQTAYFNKAKDGNADQLADVDFGEAIQFSPPITPALFLPAPEEPTYLPSRHI